MTDEVKGIHVSLRVRARKRSWLVLEVSHTACYIKETKGLAGERTISGAAAVAKQTFQYASVGSNTRSAEKTPE